MIHKIRQIIQFLMLILFLGCIEQPKKPMADLKNSLSVHRPVVMAYYVPERDYDPETIPVEKLTHIIFSFTNVIDGEMKFQNPEDSGSKLKALVRQKDRNPDLKVMIACGGWGADGFSDMASSKEMQEKFIASARAFIEEYQLDGMDMDWEYPGISGAGTKARAEDTQNFTVLMRGLRKMLDSFDQPKILTFASAGWKRYYNFIELEEVMKYADFMNIMTYDLVSGVSIYTGHHTPLGFISKNDIGGTPFQKHLDTLYDAEDIQDRHPRSTEKIVAFLLERGVNPKKLVIGAAFYGRVWKGVPPENNGLYQRSGGIHIGWIAYHQIRENYESDARFKRYWDEKAQAPYMYNALDSLLVSYDDTVSVAKKTKYVIDNKLGGIMFWELGNDTKDEHGLLAAIYKTANQK